MGKIKKLFNLLQLNFNPVKYAKKQGVTLGKNVSFTDKMNFGTEPYLVEIGDDCLIAGCTFITHEGAHHVLMGLDPSLKGTFGYGRIKVGNNVYIGHNCTILRGVTIGDNTIIGACSLVNKSCEPNSVYAGVPAKRICSIEQFKTKFLSEIPEYDKENYAKNKKDEVLKIVDKFPKR